LCPRNYSSELFLIILTIRKQAEISRERQARILKIRNDISKIFLESSEEQVFILSLSILLGATNSSSGRIGRINTDKRIEVWSLDADSAQQTGLPFSEKTIYSSDNWSSNWADAIEKQKIFITNDLAAKDDCKPKNLMIVPMFFQNDLVGILELSCRHGGYKKPHIELIENIAQFMAPVLKVRLNKAKQEKEKQQLEHRLQESQKMEAIGTLAGGIAHDFNNILSSVIGFTELCLEETQEGSEFYSNLSYVRDAGMRAKDLVKQILTLSRRDENEKKPFAIAPLVKEALKWLRSTIPTSITFRQHVSTEPLIVYGDPTQIHQIIMNLATNAVHAMTDREGVMSIRVERAGRQNNKGQGKAQSFAKITVNDSGTGIPPEHLNRIFEPYFTTKQKGEGTGLGLSVVHGIVKAHGGYYRCGKSAGQRHHIYCQPASGGETFG
jgi:signal transduction histidine kinase